MSKDVAKLGVCVLVNATLGTDAEVTPACHRTLKLDTFDPQRKDSRESRDLWFVFVRS